MPYMDEPNSGQRSILWTPDTRRNTEPNATIPDPTRHQTPPGPPIWNQHRRIQLRPKYNSNNMEMLQRQNDTESKWRINKGCASEYHDIQRPAWEPSQIMDKQTDYSMESQTATPEPATRTTHIKEEYSIYTARQRTHPSCQKKPRSKTTNPDSRITAMPILLPTYPSPTRNRKRTIR